MIIYSIYFPKFEIREQNELYMKRFGSILEIRIAQTLRIQWRLTYIELFSRIFEEEYGRLRKLPASFIFPDFSEEDILFGLKTLNDSILNNIYDKSFPEVERMVIFDGGNHEDAQDLFQRAVMILTEKVRQGRYNEKSTIYTYLYAIAKKIWENEKKKLDRRNKTFVYDKSEMSELWGGKKNKGEMIVIEIPEGFEKIEKELNKLSENCRKIINGYYYEELDMEAIAKSLGYANAASVTNQKYKCLEKLRESLT